MHTTKSHTPQTRSVPVRRRSRGGPVVPKLIKSKFTASGGETPKSSAVPGEHLSHRDLLPMKGTLFGRSSWDSGYRVSAVRLDEKQLWWGIHEDKKLQRDEYQGALNVDSTQRPLKGPFLYHRFYRWL